ncbi:MAG TPA: Holliday junction resolvase RuvX [Parachlamydiaceae bacterium]|nr:Holliday junction resolvase RuvX [Parachlamydiaceae bacterium]
MDAPKKIKPTRIIGIDYGKARFGIAVSDETKLIAMPFATVQADIKSEKNAVKILDEVAKIAHEKHCEIEKIVVGMPLMMSGKFGLQADDVTHFVKLLEEKTAIPVITWDERLTTVQAEKSLREGSMSRKKRSKVIDKVAAVIILQNYLDSRFTQENC